MYLTRGNNVHPLAIDGQLFLNMLISNIQGTQYIDQHILVQNVLTS